MSKKRKRIPHPENLIVGDRYYYQYEEDGMLTIDKGTFLEFYTRLEDDPKSVHTQDASKHMEHHEPQESKPIPQGSKNTLYLKFKKYVRGADNKTHVEYSHVPYRSIAELM